MSIMDGLRPGSIRPRDWQPPRPIRVRNVNAPDQPALDVAASSGMAAWARNDAALLCALAALAVPGEAPSVEWANLQAELKARLTGWVEVSDGDAAPTP